MGSVFDKVDVRDESSGAIRHLDFMFPVDRAAHVDKEIVTHESMPDLQRALDDLLGSDHLPASSVQVVNGPVSFLAKAAQVIFHLLEYLLRVPFAAELMQPLEMASTQKTESVQAVQYLFLSLYSLRCCGQHRHAPFLA